MWKEGDRDGNVDVERDRNEEIKQAGQMNFSLESTPKMLVPKQKWAEEKRLWKCDILCWKGGGGNPKKTTQEGEGI